MPIETYHLSRAIIGLREVSIALKTSRKRSECESLCVGRQVVDVDVCPDGLTN